MGRLRDRLRLRGRRKWVVIGGLCMLPVMGIGSVELTSQSWFCNSCHIMEPYYTSWKHGPHKDIECVKCHISPGVDNFLAAKFNGLGQVVDDVLHRTSPKPSASVSQLACTRAGCHTIEKVRATNKTTGTFKFRHDKHLDLEFDGLKLACGTCHSHVKGDEHFEVNTDVCITCHLTQGEHDGHGTGIGGTGAMLRMVVRESKGGLGKDMAAPAPAPDAPANAAEPHTKVPPSTCVTCHNPPQGVIERGGLKIDHAQYLSYGAACESCHRGATAPPEPISDGRCYECHNFGVERAKDPAEIHRIHAEGRHKIECFSCHGTVQHGPAAQTASLEQFDCRACHQDQHGVQRRTYVFDLAAHTSDPAAHMADGSPAVSPMFLAHVDCAGCHIKKRPVSVKPDSGATVAAAAAEACDKCHKPGLGGKMIPLWQKTTHDLYDRLSADLKAAQDEPGVPPDVMQETKRLLDLVRVDGSWGVHNPRYTQQLLEEARDRLAAARKPQGSTP